MFGKKLILSLLLVMAIPAFVSAGAVGFSVEDFIPDRFTDTQWKVGGDFSHNSQDQIIVNKGSNFETDKDESLSYRLSAFSKHNYAYETVPSFFHSYIDFTTKYYWSYSESNDNNIQFDRYLNSRRNSNRERHRVDFRLNTAFDYGRYMFSDYFLKVGIAPRFGYSATINEQSEYVNIREVVVDDYYQYSYNKGLSEESGNGRDISLDITFSNGWGRIYEGQYAAISKYIMEELGDKGLLNQQPTKEELLELTEKIYQFKNKHAIDSRLYQIDVLDKLYSYLIEKGFVDDSHYGVLILRDVYEYFPKDRRLFGYKAELGFGIDYYYSSNNYSELIDRYSYYTRNHLDSSDIIDIDTYSSTRSGYNHREYEKLSKEIIASFEYHKPISFKWQFDGMVSSKFYIDSYQKSKRYYSRTTGEYYSSGERQSTRWNSDRVYVNLYLGLKYFYSSRSIMEFYSRYSFKEEHGKSNSSNLTFNTNVRYRISIPTSLLINLNYSINDMETKSTYSDNDRLSLSVRFEHQIL